MIIILYKMNIVDKCCFNFEEKIIYLHGFNNRLHNDISNKLKYYFGENMIIASYDNINPLNAFEQLDLLIRGLMASDKVYLVGVSVGGFWANYFSEKYVLNCILINPVLKPAEIFKLKTNEYKLPVFKNLKAWQNYKSLDTPGIKKIILLGAKDNFIDLIYIRHIFENKFIIEDAEEGHEFKNIHTILDVIEFSIAEFDLPF